MLICTNVAIKTQILIALIGLAPAFSFGEIKPDLFSFTLQSIFDNSKPPLTFPPVSKNNARSGKASGLTSTEEYRFGWGTAPQTLPGSLGLVSGFRILSQTSDHLLRKLIKHENRSDFKFAFARLGRALILDLPMAQWSMLLVHEVFGHGGRLRSLGFNAGYGFETFGPIVTQAFTVTESGDWGTLSKSQQISIHTSGVMGTQTAALEIKREVLSRDFVHWSFWPVFLLTKLDFTGYFLKSPNPSGEELEEAANRGKDIPRYVIAISDLGGGDRGNVYRKVMAAALWNAIDPMVASGFYRYLKEHIGYGRAYTPSPMYRTKKHQFYLGTRAGLTTASPELYLEFFARNPATGATAEAYARGSFEGEVGGGIGLRNLHVSKNVKSRINFDWWGQQDLPGAGQSSLPSDNPGNAWRWQQISRTSQFQFPGPEQYAGFAFGGGFEWNFRKDMGLYADAGYKTKGTLMGRADEAGPYLDAGLLIRH